LISEAKRRANRANARLSTGPKTAKGKQQASKNARRHGLNISVLSDLHFAEEVEVLAQRIAGEGAGEECLAYARRVAECQVDLHRIRRYRHRRMIEALNGISRGSHDPCDVDGYPVGLSELGVYEHMLKRMRSAFKNCKARSTAQATRSRALVEAAPRAKRFRPEPAEVLAELAALLTKLDRYERRALSRRKSAMRAFALATRQDE